MLVKHVLGENTLLCILDKGNKVAEQNKLLYPKIISPKIDFGIKEAKK